MGDLIISRVVLLVFMLVNLFIGYGSKAVWHPISKKAVNVFFGAEFVLLTSYIIYDNITFPLFDTLFVAMIGYFFVYFVLILAYLSYAEYTKISMNEEYEAVVVYKYIIISEQYFICCNIIDNYGRYYEVYIPIEQMFKAPENKEKDMAGIYKEWSAYGYLCKEYMKYHINEIINVKYTKYITGKKYPIFEVV